MKPLTIAGGGLAGLSLGIALRQRGIPVVLREAGTYPRHRVCGEFINGVRAETLNRLGVTRAFHDARLHRSTRWSVMGRTIYEAKLPEPAMGISRYVLDKRLADEFEGCGGVLEVESRSIRKPAEGFVWAAGRKPDGRSRWLGLKIHLQELEMESGLEMHLGKHCYLGLAPVEGGRVNACGLFRSLPGVKGSRSELLWNYLAANGLQELADRLRDANPDRFSFTGVSAFLLGRQEGESGLFRLGDAECMIPPFTGNGMSMAFEAAEAAVDPLDQYAGGRVSWAESRAVLAKALRTRFRRRLLISRLLHPFLLSTPGRGAMTLTARTGLLPFSLFFRLLR